MRTGLSRGVIALVAFVLCFQVASGLADEASITLSPRVLLEEFEENALALEKKYAGRTINIFGLIAGISRDRGGQPLIRIASPPNQVAMHDPAGKAGSIAYGPPVGEVIDCLFNETQIEELVKLKKLQTISAACEKLTIKKRSVSLTGCRFVELL